MSAYKYQILICAGTGCTSSYSKTLAEAIRAELKAQNIEKDAQVVLTGCFGFCEKGPVVNILPDNTFYVQVKPQDAKEIISEHIVKGRQVARLLYTDPKTNKVHSESSDMDFYKKQYRIALRNCGVIDPENIEEAIAYDAYQALGKVLKEYTPQQTIDIIKNSGLRGRGGAGFPTGMKWEITSKSVSDVKYVVCNADEGDPGAFMDRSILEGDPHSVIEAMAICGYSIGGSNGLVYIRAEYPLAIERLTKAIIQAREYGFLGENIMGSKFSFDIEIRYGAGAFVCGEETALIHSMEGLRGEPGVRPPYPSVEGYKGKPTNVNNVETWANIPAIINKGWEWFANIGTAKSKGTKVFALAGKVNNVGLVEVPMGTTLREVIFDIGGGIRNNKKFKAVQTGGPSGGCLTEKHLDLQIDFDTLSANGSMMGSGGMIVMDEDDCMVSIAKYYLGFSVEESCGKCTPCRIGNKRLLEYLERITKGQGTMDDLNHLKNTCNVIRDTSLCGLGQNSPNPVLSTIQNFYEEYVAHIKEKRCHSHQCKDLIIYSIDKEHCIGCTACVRVCPSEAITGERKKTHTIDVLKCIKCGACVEKCKFHAILIS